MKKIYLALALAITTGSMWAQNPGLVISEFMSNPAMNDLNKEWVELRATQAINFAVTPYTVVVSNGSASANGWIEGGVTTYGFAITSGTVAVGDVVYVGGNGMAPTGVHIREINITNTGGDGFGNMQATAGVFGNGGSNADGIAVFNVPVASITSSTVPVDAIFCGTGVGSAFLTATTGFQLPLNDTYPGGKMQTTSFVAPDPGSDVAIKATGSYNITTNSWVGTRTWLGGTFTNDNASTVQLVTSAPPGTATITTNTQQVTENGGTATVNVTFANANTSPAKIAFSLSTYTNAMLNSDFTLATDTLTIPANTNGTFPFTVTLTDDLLAERTERIILKMTGSVNATIGAANYQILFLKDNDYVAPVANNELQMQLLTSFSTGPEGPNSAEIVAFDPTTDRLYTANSLGGKIDIINFANPSAPSMVNSISIAPYGNINSIAVHNGIIAAAIESSVNPQANGSVVFFDANGTFISQVQAGAMPDMITFNRNFTKVLVACEGEPKTDYSQDPEGTVAIIDLTPGYAALTNANVTMVNFQSFNGQEATLRTQGIRIFGPGSSAAQDFEPEYITLSEDNNTAYVSLQENNAMAVIDIPSGTVTSLRPLGLMDYSNDNNGMDASDQSAGVFISSVPVKGAFMPDALAHAKIGGTEYIFSANEGDAREYTAVTDVARVSATSLDPTAFPDQNILKNNNFLGRLNVLQATGDTDNDGDKDEIQVLGTRSFSIWNAATGALVFDSKDWLEQITAAHPTLSGLFNASNSSGTSAAKNRSDDKGPEPEGVATAFINGNNYLFVSLERIGGVLTFNIDNPASPVYAGYYNNRSVGANSGPDRGAEGIIYIKPEDSPNGQNIVILANEVSSTLTVYQVNTCTQLAGAVINTTEDTICSNATATLSIAGNAGNTITWLKNNVVIPGETGNSITVSQAGNYRVYVSSTAFGCADTTTATAITIKAIPTVSAGSDQSACAGTPVTLHGTGAVSYAWTGGVTNNVPFNAGATTMTYTVTGTASNGCTNTDAMILNINALPVVSAGSDQTVCSGTQVTLAGSGASSYGWNNGVIDNSPFTANATTTYTVTGTGANGCMNTDQVIVNVNTSPTVSAGNDQTVCSGTSVTLNGSGADSYVWTGSVTNNTAFTATATTTYTVTGTGPNGCTNTDQVIVNVNNLPAVSAGADFAVCEAGNITLSGSGANNYVWNNSVNNGVAFEAIETNTYTVTGTDVNGCSNTDMVMVTVNELPTVSAGADFEACEGEGITLSGSGAQDYVWNNGVNDDVEFDADETTTFTVTGTDANGCTDADMITVTVNELPVVNLGPDMTVCTYDVPVTFDAGNGFESYDWNTNATTQTVTVSNAGTYSVTVTDANGCERTDAIQLTLDACLGIEEGTLTMNVYPNPTSGIINVISSESAPMTIEILTVTGQLIGTVNGTTADLSTLSSGTYLLKITQGGVQKVIRAEKN